MNHFRFWVFVAGILGAVGVAVAAWSSHGLPHFVAPDELTVAAERARAANLHYMLHVLALLGVALWRRQGGNWMVDVAGVLFLLGILGFAGGIYVLRIILDIHTGALVYIVPAGGFCLMGGWLALAAAAFARDG